MKFASIKTLVSSLDLPLEQAERVRSLVKGEISPDEFKSVKDWVSWCYNEPSHDEKVMCALNELLEGFGVEVIEGENVDSYYRNCVASYVNMGDTYINTILLDHRSGRYQITSWGDFVTRNRL